VPLVALAKRPDAGLLALQFVEGASLPVAEMKFHETRFGSKAVRLQAERRAQQLHGLPRAQERAGDEVQSARLMLEFGQPTSIARSLLAPERVDRGVGLPLETALRVPVGLAVANEIGDRRRRHSLRTAAMSGASTAFMPTTW
jgi:hypothetical protein